jgi:Ankyrin repeats (many copies)
MARSLKLACMGWAALPAAGLALCAFAVSVQAADGASFGDPADPALGLSRMEALARVPVPSVRAALAANPSLPDELLRTLSWDPYDSVATAAQAAWTARHPSPRDKLTRSREAGTKSSMPDSAQLRAMIDHSEGTEAALQWRRLPLGLRASLVSVCQWDKTSGQIAPLLDFIVMAEPAGGPLSVEMYSQLLSSDPERIPEMAKRGLLPPVSPYEQYSRAIEAHDVMQLRALAASGVDVNAKGPGGMTALMDAAWTGDVEVIVALLDLGANAAATDDNSSTAAGYARLSLKVDAAELLARTRVEREAAALLSGQFKAAPQDSMWTGRWVAASPATKFHGFAFVVFGRDGAFDMPPGPAGRWSETDPDHVSAIPMTTQGGSARASDVRFGELSFVRLENPIRIRVRYLDEELEFHPASADPAKPADPATTAAAPKPIIGTVSAPLNLKAFAGIERVSLNWRPLRACAGYLVYRDGRLVTPQIIRSHYFTDLLPPLAPSASYQVRAADPVLRLSPLSGAVVVAPILRDSDGRGLPDRWQMHNFGHLGVDPNADPDEDGLTNLEEYKGGTDPNDFFNGVDPVIKLPYGKKPGPDDQLAIIMLHPDGRPWVNAPAPFDITSGRRRMSLVKNQPPFISKGVVRTDENGLAQIFLEPLPKP